MEKLDSLKNSLTPAVRLFNWNMIKPALQLCGIKLGDDERSLIIAGDQQILVELLQNIQNAGIKNETESNQAKKPQPTPPKSNNVTNSKRFG